MNLINAIIENSLLQEKIITVIKKSFPSFNKIYSKTIEKRFNKKTKLFFSNLKKVEKIDRKLKENLKTILSTAFSSSAL